MSRPVSGENKTYQVKVKQRNGVYYVYERTERYENGRMHKTGKDVLVGKILPDDPEGKIVPTRPKKKRIQMQTETATSVDEQSTIHHVSASRKHIGSKEILDAIARKNGIEEDIYSLLEEDIGTAQKLISCARFLTCTDGECLSHIETWQLMHPIPYTEGLSKDICHKLTEELGLNEEFRQGLFSRRMLRQKEDVLIVAYDATTVSTYSNNQSDARYGFNKDKDGLKTIKLLSLYSSENNEPLGFAKQPGNIPDVVSVKNAISQLVVLTTQKILLVTDNGFYSEENAYDLINDGIGFLMRIEIKTKWVMKYLEECLDELLESSCSCSEGGYVVGVTKTVVHNYQKTNSEGTIHTLRKHIQLHFFLDTEKRTKMKADLSVTLTDILNLINNGMPINGLSPDSQNLANQHVRFKTVRNKQIAYIDDKTVKEACKYNGIFAVVGCGSFPHVRNTKLAFTTYINREHIEDHFRAEKQSVDGNTVRSWYGDNYMGRLIIQFVALIYEDTIINEIKRIKAELEKDIKQSAMNGKDKTVAVKKQKLLTWLNRQSLFTLLSWFDAIEETNVSSQIKTKRWNTEILERDRMFLDMLGVTKI